MPQTTSWLKYPVSILEQFKREAFIDDCQHKSDVQKPGTNEQRDCKTGRAVTEHVVRCAADKKRGSGDFQRSLSLATFDKIYSVLTDCGSPVLETILSVFHVFTGC